VIPDDLTDQSLLESRTASISPGRIEGKCVPKGRVDEQGCSKHYQEGRWPVDVAPMK
jgi:hypothetical protein